uniref:Uncharacterized protein n=1 Tax=Anguilla anguilla TaxID=7936 RepID=A0A0E9VD09_ANGAN
MDCNQGQEVAQIIAY